LTPSTRARTRGALGRNAAFAACRASVASRFAFAAFAAFASFASFATLALARPAEAEPSNLDAAAAAIATQAPASAHQPPHVTVRGATRIDAHAARSSGRFLVSGNVVDDAGRPVATDRVYISISPSTGPGDLPSDVAAAKPEPCAETLPLAAAALPVLVAADRLSVGVDAAARFCVRLSLPAARYVVHIEVPTSGLLEGARFDLPLDRALRPITLRFDPERTVVSLDDETTDVGVIASVEEDGVTRGAAGIRIDLSNEVGDRLGDATTVGSGRAVISVSSARLGKPGQGELRASFAGNADFDQASYRAPVERRSHVSLSTPDVVSAETRSLAPASPEDGIVLTMVAEARCAARSCGGFPTGTVEARVGDTIVGAASLTQGRARLVATFARSGMPAAELRIRYLPDAPWFLPGEDLVLEQPLRGPSPWTAVPAGIAGLAIAAWLASTRIRGLRFEPRAQAKGDGAARHPTAHVEVLEALPAAQGWTGHVVDAHEGTPVEGGRVAIERRGFERMQVVVETRTAPDGQFALPPTEPVPGDELVCEGVLHAPLRGPLPESGDLRVALVLRKRALIERMVAWARRRGKPFDARPEPTPGHVRRAAGGDTAIGRWADAIEHAAFAGEQVDERVHAEIDHLAPPAPAGQAPAEGKDQAPTRAARPRPR
jgi:hypothetical protein